MKFSLMIAFVVIFYSLSVCQIVPQSTGSAAGLGVGQATVAWNDSHSAINNQAGIVGIEHWGIQMSAANLYGISGLNSLTASVIKKLNEKNAISFSIKHFGDSDLNNQIIGLAYARKLSKKLNISLQGDLLAYQTKNFGNKYLGTVELGILYHATKKVKIGFHIFNPMGQALTPTEDVPAIIRLGGLYDVSKKVKIMAEIEKNILLNYNIKVGIEYKIIEKLKFRTGFSSGGRQFNFGLAYKMGNFSIHGTSSIHSHLGITPSGEISFTK